MEGTANASEIIKAVELAGYGAALKGEKKEEGNTTTYEEDILKDRETPILKTRLYATSQILETFFFLFYFLFFYFSTFHKF